MEDKIEVGEYVRTVDGKIGKVRVIIQHMIFINENQYFHDLNKIKSHSKNIIDLIEVGDFVNGLEVYKGKVASGKEKLLVGNHIINGMALEVVNIKSIVTKEQFENVKYEVKKC